VRRSFVTPRELACGSVIRGEMRDQEPSNSGEDWSWKCAPREVYIRHGNFARECIEYGSRPSVLRNKRTNKQDAYSCGHITPPDDTSGGVNRIGDGPPESVNTFKLELEFHDADTDTDVLNDMSDTRDSLKLFLWQGERRADILATILARISARKSGRISRHRHPREYFCGNFGVSGESGRILECRCRRRGMRAYNYPVHTVRRDSTVEWRRVERRRCELSITVSRAHPSVHPSSQW